MARKTWFVPLAVLATVGFGTAAIAASPGLVGSGTAGVSSCSAGAHVMPHVGFNAAVSGYQITTVSITTGSGCAGLTYHVSLLGPDRQLLTESTGHLGRDGSAIADVNSRHVPADGLGGVAVTLTGAERIYFR